MSINLPRAKASTVITITPLQSNRPDAPNAAIALRFHSGGHLRGVGDPERSAELGSYDLSSVRS
jgi:hypothetical protein